jgi:hypothetical protein
MSRTSWIARRLWSPPEVNWFEIEIVNAAGKVTYHNSFITDLPVTSDTRPRSLSPGG